ncbi:hypothetical protein [Streptomyces sp. NPDC012616]|uniref:hypothetical protein n=1 Tax=Streptomyces sp. NPDC012616 TaxID=3364840 RepID=UPI0036E1FE84
MPTINVAVRLAVVVVLRLCRRRHSSSRFDEKLTVVLVLVLALGVLIAPTPGGLGISNILGQLASGVTQTGR